MEYKDRLKVKTEGGKRYIWDFIRKKYLVLAPEEMVRQLVIHWLIESEGVCKNRIAIEKQLMVNDRKKRCDILVYGTDMCPFLLVECKAPDVPLTEQTFRQIAWYNMPLKVPFLMVTNGAQSYICTMDYEEETFKFISKLPDYQ